MRCFCLPWREPPTECIFYSDGALLHWSNLFWWHGKPVRAELPVLSDGETMTLTPLSGGKFMVTYRGDRYDGCREHGSYVTRDTRSISDPLELADFLQAAPYGACLADVVRSFPPSMRRDLALRKLGGGQAQ